MTGKKTRRDMETKDGEVFDYICKKCSAGSHGDADKCWNCGGKIIRRVVGALASDKEAASVEKVLTENAGSAW